MSGSTECYADTMEHDEILSALFGITGNRKEQKKVLHFTLTYIFFLRRIS